MHSSRNTGINLSPFLIEGRSLKRMPHTEDRAMPTVFQHLMNALKCKPGVVLDIISITVENRASKPQRGYLTHLKITAIP
jgi:hypothetical protein